VWSGVGVGGCLLGSGAPALGGGPARVPGGAAATVPGGTSTTVPGGAPATVPGGAATTVPGGAPATELSPVVIDWILACSGAAQLKTVGHVVASWRWV